MNEITEIHPHKTVVIGDKFTDFIQWIDRGERTTKTYLNNLKQFASWIKYRGIERPERGDILNYKEWLQLEHEAIQLDPQNVTGWSYRTDSTGQPLKIICKANTAAQYIRSVCQFFKWAAANNLYPDIAQNIHAPKVSNERHKKDCLKAGDVKKIEESIARYTADKKEKAGAAAKDTAGRLQRTDEQGKRLFAIYLLSVTAGLRTIEISRANIKDFEERDGRAWLYIWGKGRSEADQKKALAPAVAEAIKDYISSRTDRPTKTAPLFVSTGNRSGGKRIAATTISTMLKKAMQQAGYNSERLTAHSLRHTAGTAVQALTSDLYTTQKYMRHSSPVTTERYLHNNTEDKEAGIAARLYNYYHRNKEESGKEKLHSIIDTLTPEQVEQLINIAETIKG